MKFGSNPSIGKSWLTVSHNGTELSFEATCSRKDQFNRKLGQEVVLKKYLTHLPRTERKDIWINYFNQHNKSKLKFVK